MQINQGFISALVCSRDSYGLINWDDLNLQLMGYESKTGQGAVTQNDLPTDVSSLKPCLVKSLRPWASTYFTVSSLPSLRILLCRRMVSSLSFTVFRKQTESAPSLPGPLNAQPIGLESWCGHEYSSALLAIFSLAFDAAGWPRAWTACVQIFFQPFCSNSWIRKDKRRE